MNQIIGILLIVGGGLYSAYALTTEDFEIGPKFYLQVAVMGLGAIYILWESIMDFFKSQNSDKKPLDGADDDMLVDKDHQYCQKDFECLTYLRDRARNIESKEAVDLVVKLNNILFCGKNEK